LRNNGVEQQPVARGGRLSSWHSAVALEAELQGTTGRG